MKHFTLKLAIICCSSLPLLGMQGNNLPNTRKRTHDQLTPVPKQKGTSVLSPRPSTPSSHRTTAPASPLVIPSSSTPSLSTPSPYTRDTSTPLYQPLSPFTHSSNNSTPYSPGIYSQPATPAAQMTRNSEPFSPAPYTPHEPRSSYIPPFITSSSYSSEKSSASRPTTPTTIPFNRSIPSSPASYEPSSQPYSPAQTSVTNSKSYNSTTSTTPSYVQVRTLMQATTAYNAITTAKLITITPCYCGEKFKDKEKFKKHILMHLTLDTQGKTNFICQMCPENSGNIINFQDHGKVHNYKYNICYECNICLQTFPNREAGENHLQTHSKIRSIDNSSFAEASVDQSDEPVSRYPQPQPHNSIVLEIDEEEEDEEETTRVVLQIDEEEEEEDYIYSIPLTFNVEGAKANKNRMALRARSCPCTPGYFKSYQELITHVNNTHLQGGSYKCFICPKQIVIMNKFILHGLKHNNHLVLTCMICNANFTSYKEILTHMQSHPE